MIKNQRETTAEPTAKKQSAQLVLLQKETRS
jgi:hypothetical protein